MRSRHQNDIIHRVFRDRPRTNLLKHQEQKTIAWLLPRLPRWMTPNFLTGVGLAGNILVAGSFILATCFSRTFLLLGLAGFMISWFGDSLDGRLAFYRKIPRKNYGFTLDVTIDWISIIIIGLGYIIYADGAWELLGYGFVVMYGWEMILALIHFKLTGEYVIDSGKLGPTEVRIIICLMLIIEVLFPGCLYLLAALVTAVLFVFNIIDTHKLLRVADRVDNRNSERETDAK